MGRITTGIGLVSGINSKDIIDQLIALEGQQKTILQTRQATITAQQAAYKDLITGIGTLQTSGKTFARPTTFNASAATSSNENVLTATTSAGAPVGTFQIQVARLVTSQQSVSTGFANYDSAPIASGNSTITLEMGGGEVNSQTLLSDLNGGVGVSRGKFRITDRSGNAAVIDTSNAVSLDDVIKKINTSLDVSVRASVSGDKLVLTDNSGSTAQALTVTDLADGTAAASLGLTANAAVGNTLTGGDINSLATTTLLSSLNDGRGVRTSATAADITITTRGGSTFDIDLGGAGTIGDVITAINTAGNGTLTASIDSTTNALKITDNSGGGGTFAVAADVGSNAAKDLGLLGQTAASGVITGKPILASIDSVLLSSLNGGNGFNLGNLTITDRSGANATINLAGYTSVQDVLDRISNAGAVGVTAKLNASGNGIAISDDTGGTGNLTIADTADGTTTATLLGLNQSVDTTKAAVSGANLQRQWINENTLLSKYNGGKGVTPGSFKITSAAGTTKEFNVGTGQFTKLGEVINAINTAAIGVTASINAHGDGLLLTDTSGGAGKLTVANLTGTTATDLQIAGTATATTIDGTFEKTIDVTATDTLSTLQTKVSTLGFGVKASIINDGSSGSPFRLSLNAINTGRAGRVVIDGGATNLGIQSLVKSQDAAVFVGGGESAQPLLVTASGNTLAGVLPGVTLNLNSASDSPVTLSITRDVESVVDEVKKFSDGFNSLITKISDLTKWDSDKNQGGLLLGDYTAQSVQSQLYASLQTVVSGAGRYRIFADVGITLDDQAQVSFDEDKFREAYATDPEAVKNLFTQVSTGLGAQIDAQMARLIDPVDGAVVRQNKTLDDRNTDFQDRINKLDDQLATKRARLEKQFSDMETVLAKLQTQQSSIANIKAVA